MKTKKALIFGVTGQDGAYLSRLLLDKAYKVFGVTRSKLKKNIFNLIKLKIDKKIKLILSRDLTKKDIYKIINKTLPDEIYFLAGQSSVGVSFQKPVITYLSNNIPLFYILEYCRLFNKKIKIYNSASSECFGNNNKVFCNEKTIFNPVSPYGRSKSFSFFLTKYYRNNYELSASNGILFNHESSLRRKEFVTKKIISYALNFNKKSKKLLLGNTKIRRDWGWADDYVKAIYMINSSNINDDYIIGSGKHYSLKNIFKLIFKEKNIPLKMVQETKKLQRKNEISKICADTRKIKKEFNWKTHHSINDIKLNEL